ncbi:MAG: type II toxin-antitoxin system VapC family toxin [bacterium]|nr:type II toxin-antitoxin system VapC family toxin [bacterium]
MILLLDTHVLLWWLASPEDLVEGARKAIESPTNDVVVSAASIWEMAIKQSLGKLSLPGDPVEAITALGFHLLPITAAHGWRAGRLPPLHRDPFDRLLVAQADSESLVLVTRDRDIPRYGIPVLPG